MLDNDDVLGGGTSEKMTVGNGRIALSDLDCTRFIRYDIAIKERSGYLFHENMHILHEVAMGILDFSLYLLDVCM